MRKRVTFLKLHEAFQQPGTPISTLSKTLSWAKGPSQAEMWYTPDGIEVTVNAVTFIVPLANVVGASLEKDSSK